MMTSDTVKLIDFGFATQMDNRQKIKLFCGTPGYLAPEIVKDEGYSGPPVDIWAMGVVLYIMLTGYYPFVGKN